MLLSILLLSLTLNQFSYQFLSEKVIYKAFQDKNINL